MKLKPCPFCGGTELLSEPWLTKMGVFVECKKCGCIGPRKECSNDAEWSWNNRDYETCANEVRARYGKLL